MSSQPLVVDTHGPVAVWRLNRPEIRNPLTAELKMAFAEQAARFIADDGLKSLVVTGTDDCFCAGGDLRSLDMDRRTVAVQQRMRSSHSWMKLLVNSDKPVIMAVNGAAVGAGASLALMGDIVVASDTAYFMSGFPKVGVLPDLAILYNLPRLVGLAHAKDFLMTSRRVDAHMAMSMGMVSRVLPRDELLDGAIQIAAEMANGPLVSLGLTKALLNHSQGDSLEAFLLREEAAQAVVFGTDDFLEGATAFREKRKPDFKGR
ncbi:enoyl-CoA hydratase/isomerase family protein [Mesorhizobium sp. ANAO-SY3R2]|uniref:enoyl-CoA hydratase/isomerase family protein n=1 Tax=Mesorhizobium sp. ANAO-SY3R2 TaxID=3166644 RepID=UPI0036734CFA